MQYFNTLPLVSQNTYNVYGNNQVVTNLLTRAYFLPKLLKNVMLFYQYDIKEGETPESIAHSYYNDIYKYWIVLYSNNIIDPLNDWPKTSSQFELYLLDKYKEQANGVPVIAYTMSTIHHYEKIIATTDDVFFETKVLTLQIDEDTYNSLMPSSTKRTFSTGTIVTQEITKRAVSIYDYENKVNEDKRNINIMKDQYVTELEYQFKRLME